MPATTAARRPALLRLCAALLPVCALAAAPAAKPAAPANPAAANTPEAKERQAKMVRLRVTVLGDDPLASQAAVQELLGLGDAGKVPLADALKVLLPRDQTRADAAAKLAGDPAQTKAAEAEMATLRDTAGDNLRALDKGPPMAAAKARYDKMLALSTKLQPVLANRAVVFEVMARRPGLKQAWEKVAAPAAKLPYDPAAEAKLAATAKQALGVPAEDVVGLDSLTAPDPAEPGLWAVWNFWCARQVDAYNRSLLAAGVVDAGEMDVLRPVNAYREMLGVRPLEVEPRLTQVARRQAKVLAEAKSAGPAAADAALTADDPTRTPAARRREAAYTAEPGGESVAAAVGRVDAVFRAWFDSPADHANLVNRSFTGVGVGRWDDRWVTSFGPAPRLMLATADQRAAAAVPPTYVLPPQSGASAAARRPNGQPGQTANNNPNGNQQGQNPNLPVKPRIPGGAGSVPNIPSIPSLPGGF